MAQSILFVCLGNICRSPTAEGVVKVKAARRGLNLVLDSAGTGPWHAGEPPYGPMQNAAAARGYDLSALRARQVAREDFGKFDLIIAMDQDNLSALRCIAPNDGVNICLLTDFAGDGRHEGHIPDPYYTRDFEGTLDLIELCADGLLDRLEV